MTTPQNRQCVIRTPEGISFSLDLAGPVSRFMAWIIDSAAVMAGTNMAMLLLQAFSIISRDIAFGMIILILVFSRFVYSIGMEWFWRGQTLGKFVTGIRVVDAQGFRLTFSQVVLRNLLRLVDSLPFFYLIGGITMLINKRAQRLGDLAANSMVIRRRKIRQPDLDQILPDKYNSFRAYPHLEARLRHHTTPEHAGILVQALLRRDEFDPQARVTCYQEIADSFRDLVTFPEEATIGLSDEQYLRNVTECLFNTHQQRTDLKKD